MIMRRSARILSRYSSNALITLALAKEHLRIEHSDDDATIQRYIDAANRYIERKTRSTIQLANIEWAQESFTDEIVLTLPPIRGIASLEYIDSNDSPVTMPAEDYRVDFSYSGSIIRPAYNTTWPSGGDLVITGVAGYGEFDDLGGFAYIFPLAIGVGALSQLEMPSELTQAALLMIGHFYENREATAVGVSVQKLPYSVEALTYAYTQPRA